MTVLYRQFSNNLVLWLPFCLNAMITVYCLETMGKLHLNAKFHKYLYLSSVLSYVLFM